MTAAAVQVRAVSAGRRETACPPTTRLSSAGVPSATTLPRSITAMSSARASASSRYWVVSRTVVPSSVSSRTVRHSSSRLPARAWARPRIVPDPGVAATAGAAGADDDTETALRLHRGRVVSRSEERGAAHAVAAFTPGTGPARVRAGTPNRR
ncbi:hypothetical protein [Nocardiopsis terrae]|nr:hypothetical protein [Nocardiopsis terrae]